MSDPGQTGIAVSQSALEHLFAVKARSRRKLYALAIADAFRGCAEVKRSQVESFLDYREGKGWILRLNGRVVPFTIRSK